MGNDDKVSLKPLQHIYYLVAILAALLAPWLWVHSELATIKTDIAVIKQQVYDHVNAGHAAAMIKSEKSSVDYVVP